MSIALWIIAYTLIGLLLLLTLVYVGVLSYKTYVIRRENRKMGYNYGFIIGTPSEGDGPASAKDTPPSPKRLEASVKPPTVPPYSGKTLWVEINKNLVTSLSLCTYSHKTSFGNDNAVSPPQPPLPSYGAVRVELWTCYTRHVDPRFALFQQRNTTTLGLGYKTQLSLYNSSIVVSDFLFQLVRFMKFMSSLF